MLGTKTRMCTRRRRPACTALQLTSVPRMNRTPPCSNRPSPVSRSFALVSAAHTGCVKSPLASRSMPLIRAHFARFSNVRRLLVPWA